jgi:hypothetical protein
LVSSLAGAQRRLFGHVRSARGTNPRIAIAVLATSSRQAMALTIIAYLKRCHVFESSVSLQLACPTTRCFFRLFPAVFAAAPLTFSIFNQHCSDLFVCVSFTVVCVEGTEGSACHEESKFGTSQKRN